MGTLAHGDHRPLTWRRRIRLARRFLTYALAIAPLLGLLRVLPGPVLRAFLVAVVEPVFWLATRGASRRHLAHAFGDAMQDAERRRIARAVARNFVRGAGELVELLRHGAGPFLPRIDDRDARALAERLRGDGSRGFVAITAHLGNWELLGSWFAAAGIVDEIAAVATRHSNPWLDRRIVGFRARLGLATFHREESSRELLRYLKDGHAVAIVPDQDVKNVGGVFIDFFGKPAYTPTGPARLALAAQVPLACGVLVRVEGGRYRLLVSEPIEPDKTAPREAEILRLTKAWSAELERMIRACPEQWCWFHARWRTTPERLAARGRKPKGSGETAD